MIYKYLFRQFTGSFLSIFLTLLLVSSIIILFQIAKLTSFIEVSILELAKLYLLMSIKLIIFTTPISFFIAVSMCILRLSRENEIIMLFSLGYSPRKISRFFTFISCIISGILIIISLIFIPISFGLYDNFIDYKKTFAQLNLKSNNYGQKFGEWIYFSDTNDGVVYNNIMLYSPKDKKGNKKIIYAKSGEIFNENNKVQFNLKDVIFYNFDKTTQFNKIEELNFYTQLENKTSNIESIKDYWKDFKRPGKSKELVIYLLLSLLPIASVKYALAFSIISSRYEKSSNYFAMFVFFCLYFTPIALFMNYHFYTIGICLIFFITLSNIVFYKKVIRKY